MKSILRCKRGIFVPLRRNHENDRGMVVFYQCMLKSNEMLRSAKYISSCWQTEES